MNSEYIGEALGTFVFVYIALTQTEPITIAVGLFVGILIAMTFRSKSFLNPGIAIGNYFGAYCDPDNKSKYITGDEAVKYIGAEFVGVALSLAVFYMYVNQPAINNTPKLV
jgi:glycerol uptake facilitator-like aquaporin